MLGLSSVLARIRAALADSSAELCAAGFAVCWFYTLGYGPSLSPTAIAWTFREDWAAFYWGFAFSREAPWAFPLGAVPNLFYPHGTSVAFTDANPWFALLFNLLSPALPDDFQFMGIWFLLCYVLQAWFGAKLTRAFSSDPLLCALGGALFATTPILPMRVSHVALCGLFFVTAGIWLNLARMERARDAHGAAFVSLALLAWAAGTHGYLSVMLLALALALYLRLWCVERLLTGRAAILFSLGAFVVTLSVYYLFGYIGWRKTELTAEGFGDFSADLLALVNPQGRSSFLPAQPYRPRQWEGFAYLGIGTIALLLLAFVRALFAPGRALRGLRRQWPLLLVTFAMLVYSWSSIVTYRAETVLDLSQLYAHLGQLPSIFRSSGRFGWPMHLLLTSAAVAAVAAFRQRLLARLLLACALAAQVAEQGGRQVNFDPVPLHPLEHEAWRKTMGEYDHLALLPVQIQWVCPYDERLVNALSYRAYRSHLSFNSGNFMRKEAGTVGCGLGLSSAPDARTVYVIDPGLLADFRARGAVCGGIDGLIVCAAGGRRTELVRALERVGGV